MQSPQHAAEPGGVATGQHVAERVKAFFHHLVAHHSHASLTHHEPTVVEIVDHVVAMHYGESCDVEIDPHNTRIRNLEKLLPICVEQFGRSIAMRERSEGEKTILTITVTGEWSARARESQ